MRFGNGIQAKMGFKSKSCKKASQDRLQAVLYKPAWIDRFVYGGLKQRFCIRGCIYIYATCRVHIDLYGLHTVVLTLRRVYTCMYKVYKDYGFIRASGFIGFCIYIYTA